VALQDMDVVVMNEPFPRPVLITNMGEDPLGRKGRHIIGTHHHGLLLVENMQHITQRRSVTPYREPSRLHHYREMRMLGKQLRWMRTPVVHLMHQVVSVLSTAN
jgi:hypothetical protein